MSLNETQGLARLRASFYPPLHPENSLIFLGNTLTSHLCTFSQNKSELTLVSVEQT